MFRHLSSAIRGLTEELRTWRLHDTIDPERAKALALKLNRANTRLAKVVAAHQPKKISG